MAAALVQQPIQDNDNYILMRSFAASARLDLQHFMWKDAAGGRLLHSSIPIEDQNLRVADIGTGTGIWAMDLARQLPATAELTGLDLDLAQCPDSDFLPQNVKFRQLDIYEDIPMDIAESYDIIHCRYMLLVVRDAKPEILLNQALRLLKPGGYIQWSETEIPKIRPVKSQSASSDEASVAFLKVARSFMPDLSWSERLQNVLTEAGLQRISYDRVRCDSVTQHLSTISHMVTMQEMLEEVARRGRFSDDEMKEMKNLLAMARGEARQGVIWELPMFTAVAQKPR